MQLASPTLTRALAALLACALLVTCTDSGAEPEDPGAVAPSTTPAPAEAVGNRPAWLEAACELPPEYVTRIRRGYFPGRSPDINVVPKEPNFFGGFSTTSHSGPWDYVQRVPLVFYGPGFIKSQGELELDREVTIADMAPTLAELLGFEWPADRAGRLIEEVLVPADERPNRPKVVLVIAWDGGGWNVLDQWPDAWPYLAELMDKGTSVTDVIVGTSPSVTPASHAVMGTGTFPNQHGIVDIPLRDGDRIVGSYDGRSPKYLEVPALGDLHDSATGNRAKIGIFSYKSWHWGMMGHGSYLEGGDKDIAILAERSAGELETNPTWYSLPSYLPFVGGFDEDVQQVDLEDGQLDNTWMGNEILDDPNLLRETPAWVLYQTRLITTVLENEGFGLDNVPDIFFTNYKQIDEIGHSYNMLSPEMPEILRYSDDALADLTGFLDEQVGKKEWVIAVTADHGQTPNAIDTGAWPIRMVPLREAIAKHFDVDPDELFDEDRVTGFWINPETIKARNITLGEIADFVLGYTIGDNAAGGGDVPQQYRDRFKEPLFDAAFPSKKLPQIQRCVEEGP